MKFEDKTGVAYRFLERIRLIYEFEKSYKKLSDEERQEQRALDVIPILNDMYQDLLYYANTATAKCGELLMKAINYAKAEWKGLIKYIESCKLNNINPYDYWSDLIDFIGCELLEQRRHTKASFLFAES